MRTFHQEQALVGVSRGSPDSLSRKARLRMHHQWSRYAIQFRDDPKIIGEPLSNNSISTSDSEVATSVAVASESHADLSTSAMGRGRNSCESATISGIAWRVSKTVKRSWPQGCRLKRLLMTLHLTAGAPLRTKLRTHVLLKLLYYFELL